MRFVGNPSTTRADGSELMDGARCLVDRFAHAGLRTCSLLRVGALDERVGARVWLALESLQVTGSFKVRGALLALSQLFERGAKSIVAASAGNHGAGVAFAAQVLGMHALVVVPKSAPRSKCDRITGYGAELRFAGEGYDAAEHEAREIARSQSLPFVSPYDDVAVLSGNGGSLGIEIERALGHAPTTLVVPLGGGGLATGLAWSLPHTRVLGAQSEASPAFAMSLERGAAVETLPPCETHADGLEGGISSAAFARAAAAVDGVFVATEVEIAQAMATVFHNVGMAIEGSAATAVAALQHGSFTFGGARPHDVVAVVTGRNVDADHLQSVLAAHPSALW